jgi:hypothetical protein
MGKVARCQQLALAVEPSCIGPTACPGTASRGPLQRCGWGRSTAGRPGELSQLWVSTPPECRCPTGVGRPRSCPRLSDLADARFGKARSELVELLDFIREGDALMARRRTSRIAFGEGQNELAEHRPAGAHPARNAAVPDIEGRGGWGASHGHAATERPERSPFQIIIVGKGNGDPYAEHETAIHALGSHFGLILDRAHCYPSLVYRFIPVGRAKEAQGRPKNRHRRLRRGNGPLSTC